MCRQDSTFCGLQFIAAVNKFLKEQIVYATQPVATYIGMRGYKEMKRNIIEKM
jgi:hypothetical protein